jgi:NTP pyrophosphatase (non-canonical NTP hydrolase)
MLTPDLVNALLEFRRVRDWEQFHTPRNLASALSVEAAELLEHFVWANDQQVTHITEERRAEIMAEVADIAILLTYLAHDLSIDLEAVVSEKMAANERKYPLEKSYGSNKKYTDL